MDINRIKKLCTISNMSFIELYEDPQFNKIPKENIKGYISSIENIARSKAVKLKNENPNISLLDICKSKGITVNIIKKDDSVSNIHYRAEIFYEKKIINIVKNSITEMLKQLRNLNFYLSMNKIEEIHLAHELYHLIEYIDGEETGNLLPKVTSIKIGKFEKKSKIIRASEAAAHIFCLEMLELPFHPRLLDYLYLVAVGEVTEEKLIEYLEDIQKAYRSNFNI